MLCLSLFVIGFYILCDVNYFIRTIFVVLWGRLYEQRNNISDTTIVYGFGTFQDCDVWFKHVRLSRLVRELDFARYHFYDRTGIYRRSHDLGIQALQGSTLTRTFEEIPIFAPYKITTQLVYWDDRSLFLKHEVATLYDYRVRCCLVSRQYALGVQGLSTKALLKDFEGYVEKPSCPEFIQSWLKSMEISSTNLRGITTSQNK